VTQFHVICRGLHPQFFRGGLLRERSFSTWTNARSGGVQSSCACYGKKRREDTTIAQRWIEWTRRARGGVPSESWRDQEKIDFDKSKTKAKANKILIRSILLRTLSSKRLPTTYFLRCLLTTLWFSPFKPRDTLRSDGHLILTSGSCEFAGQQGQTQNFVHLGLRHNSIAGIAATRKQRVLSYRHITCDPVERCSNTFSVLLQLLLKAYIYEYIELEESRSYVFRVELKIIYNILPRYPLYCRDLILT
jgi:hypothetical protein